MRSDWGAVTWPGENSVLVITAEGKGAGVQTSHSRWVGGAQNAFQLGWGLCVHMYVCARVEVCMHARVCACVYVYARMCVVCAYVYEYACAYVVCGVCVRVCMCSVYGVPVCVRVCVLQIHCPGEFHSVLLAPVPD